MLRAEPITCSRLTLTPLRAADADAMAGVLGDPAMYEFTGGQPPTPADLRRRYELLERGTSPDHTEGWLNWIVRLADATPVGVVQATVPADLGRAELAWEIGTAWQRRGVASEAAMGMVAWLFARGVWAVEAAIAPGHAASEAVARRVGLVRTDEARGGETVWRASGPEGRTWP